MKTIKTGTEIMLPSMRYIVQVMPLEEHPGHVGFETRVTCPDGRILQTRRMEDLSIFRKDDFIIDHIALGITAGLLDGLRKEIKDKVSQSIYKVMTE